MGSRISSFLSSAKELIFGSVPERPPLPHVVFNATRRAIVVQRIEVADRGEKRRKGLLGRKYLPEGEGLWIVPCEAVHTFGMQFAIDLIYLDKRHRVLKIRRSVGPGRISGCLRAHSVMELPAGSLPDSHAKKGDQLVIEPASPFLVGSRLDLRHTSTV